MGEPQPSKELLDLPSEPKPPSFIESLLAVQRAAATQGGQAQRRASHRTTPQEPREQQQHKEGKRNAGPPTEPLPKSQVLGKVKDLLGEIAKANEKLQLDAQSKPLEEYEVEALTGNEKEYIVFPIVEYTPWCSYQKTSISIIYRGPRCAVIVPLKVPAWSLLS